MRLFAKQVRQTDVTMTVACQPAAAVMLHSFSECPRLVALGVLTQMSYSELASLVLITVFKDV